MVENLSLSKKNQDSHIRNQLNLRAVFHLTFDRMVSMQIVETRGPEASPNLPKHNHATSKELLHPKAH